MPCSHAWTSEWRMGCGFQLQCLAPPLGRTTRLVLQQDAGGLEVAADRVGTPEIPGLLRGRAFGDQRLHVEVGARSLEECVRVGLQQADGASERLQQSRELAR